MSSPPKPSGPPRTSGLSLYANLLDPTASTPGSIAKGPVPAPKPEETAAKKNIDLSALRFHPAKRPLIAQKTKPKPKTSFPKATPAIPDNSTRDGASPATSAVPAAKNTLADWAAADDDVNDYYGGGEKRQRGGRKRKKQKREEHVAAQDWDDIYDPTRPNSYEEYKHSDEKIREVTDWKDRLYAHRRARKAPSEDDSEEEDYRPRMNNKFAPPPNSAFAPPPMDSPPKLSEDSPAATTFPPPPPPPPSQESSIPPAPSEPVVAGVITRAPVRYNLPPPPSDIPSSEAELEKALAEEPAQEEEEEEEAPRSLRPGQKGFAERLMSKYGWSKGEGLGADGSGIVSALQVKVEKRKKKSDAEGGGFRDPPGARGTIIGGKKNVPVDKEKEAEVGKFGAMSEVIVLRGMVDGMDLDEEVEVSGDGGLMQEIGDECAEKYGRVERVYIDRHGAPPAKVFVKFTSQLSALRAVNALEGRIFNGNTISALFFDAETFERGVYV